MKSPNQSTAKTFLNVTIYKPLKENPAVSLPESATIDITNLMDEHGVESFYNINGVSRCNLDEKGKYGDTPTETQFVITEQQLLAITVDLHRIIDAAIVNTKQAEAIKSLVNDQIEGLIKSCWESIRG